MFELFDLYLQQICTKTSLVRKAKKSDWLAHVLYNGKSQCSKNKAKIVLYFYVYVCPYDFVLLRSMYCKIPKYNFA